jgi:glycine/D-amino acid oxidase-like deaminating enzyme
MVALLTRPATGHVGAGFSGHGFKHAPAVGRVLADLAGDRAASAVGATAPTTGGAQP